MPNEPDVSVLAWPSSLAPSREPANSVTSAPPRGFPAYLKLADNLESFLARLRCNAATASTDDRRRVLRLLVKDVLIGPEKITIRHRIPVREPASGGGHHDTTDTEGDMRNSYQLCWGRGYPPMRGESGVQIRPVSASAKAGSRPRPGMFSTD